MSDRRSSADRADRAYRSDGGGDAADDDPEAAGERDRDEEIRREVPPHHG